MNIFQKSTSQFAKQIGVCLWWTLTQTSVPHRELVAAAEKWGIPQGYLPKEITFISAFTRAIASVKAGLDKSSGILIRDASNNGHESILAIVLEDKDEKAKAVKHLQIGTITADKIHKVIRFKATSEADKVSQVETTVREAYSKAVDHNTEDIRKVILSFCRQSAVSLRESGGIYFVPVAYIDVLDRIKAFIKDVSPQSVLYLKPEYIINDADLEVLRSTSKSELVEEISKLEEAYQTLVIDINDYKQRKKTLTRNRRDGLSSNLQDYLEMKKRIEVFSQTLNFAGDSLVSRLGSLHSKLSSELEALRIKVKSDLDWDSSQFDLKMPEPDQPQLPQSKVEAIAKIRDICKSFVI